MPDTPILEVQGIGLSRDYIGVAVGVKESRCQLKSVREMYW